MKGPKTLVIDDNIEEDKSNESDESDNSKNLR